MWRPALLLVLLSCPPAPAHVRLNFPEGRDLTLDFLDTFRTPPPCGMPRGEAKTTLEAGGAFNVTWHLSYPHQGESGSPGREGNQNKNNRLFFSF